MHTILIGDARQQLATIPAGTIQTCVTSPPYFGLRDYGHDGQIGLEQTVAAYVQALVDVFREVRRVLRDDGTLWCNLGDSYVNAGGAGTQGANGQRASRTFTAEGLTKRGVADGLKSKDLIGVPWRVAFALQADGWWLRQCNVWHKPNPMPESVTDRTTTAHEYVFHLTKSSTYYYDAEAIAEKAAASSQERAYLGKRPHSKRQNDLVENGTHGESDSLRVYDRATRNKRSVWAVPTVPFRGSHFAVFPPKLIEPCILAGSREGDTVLDPFAGSGTTGAVAELHGRHAVLIELNPEYRPLIERRLAQRPLWDALGVAG